LAAALVQTDKKQTKCLPISNILPLLGH